MEKEIQQFERNLLWLGNVIIAVLCLALFVAIPHFPTAKKEAVYKLTDTAYVETLRYILKHGELNTDGEMYSVLTMDKGYATPPHGTMLHKVEVYAITVPVSTNPRVIIAVHYSRATGSVNKYNQAAYKYHTSYYFTDFDFDGRPDEIQKRYIETNYATPGMWITKNFKTDHWGYWDKYLVELYRLSKIGGENVPI